MKKKQKQKVRKKTKDKINKLVLLQCQLCNTTTKIKGIAIEL